MDLCLRSGLAGASATALSARAATLSTRHRLGVRTGARLSSLVRSALSSALASVHFYI